jgi:hypothetical protein
MRKARLLLAEVDLLADGLDGVVFVGIRRRNTERLKVIFVAVPGPESNGVLAI